MKKYFLAGIVCVFASIVQSVFAISSPTNVTLESSTNTTLGIKWDPVDGSSWYYVYYGSESGVGKGYLSQVPDLIEGTTTIIPNLDPGTQYYVAVTAINQNGDESAYSSEVVFTTQSVSQGDGLSVTGLKILDTKTLELDFNLDLDDDPLADRTFKILERGQINELLVQNIQLTGNKSLSIEMQSPFSPSKKYDLTILSLFAQNGKTIEIGVDGIVSFTTPSVFTESNFNVNILEVGGVPVGSEELNAAESTSTGVSEGGEDLLATTTTPSTTPLPQTTESAGDLYSGNGGKTISSEDLKKNSVNAVKAATDLPETGPENYLLLIIALLMGFGIFILQRKNIN